MISDPFSREIKETRVIPNPPSRVGSSNRVRNTGSTVEVDLVPCGHTERRTASQMKKIRTNRLHCNQCEREADGI